MYHTGGGGGCLGSLGGMMLTIVLLIIIIIAVIPSGNNSGNNNSGTDTSVTSTVNRERLASGSVNETDYYTDGLGWINDESVLLKGMKHFYNETGIQPYLVLSEALSSTNTVEEGNAFATSLYDELFTDEAHFLVVYIEDLDSDEMGHVAYVTGSAARSVMDTEAIDIFYSNLNKYWFNESYSTEAVFSNTFRDTADTIMKQTTNKYDVWRIVVIAVAVIIIIVIAVIWWKARTAQKNKEQEDLERTLNRPLDTFGDSGLGDLKKKYDKDNPS